jgi:glycosyltransferase involved in cell wall biosynthesis
MTRRTLVEMEDIDPAKIIFLPFPIPSSILPHQNSGAEPVKRVGVITYLDGAADLHALVIVAHRLLNQDPTLEFRIVGRGPLRKHLERMAQELDLGARFVIHSSNNEFDIKSVGAALFAPLQADHFIPLLSFVSCGIPVVSALSAEWNGLSSSDVPLASVHDTMGIAELLERLLQDQEYATTVAGNWRKFLERTFGWSAIEPLYRSVFLGQPSQTLANKQAA